MNKLLLTAAMGSVLLLSGCASDLDAATSEKINQSATKLDELSTQVSTLTTEVAALKAQQTQLTEKTNDAINAAQAEAERANSRIDNIAQSYTK